MKILPILFSLCMLTACTSVPQYDADTFLLDSNVTASVYCGNTFLGTTPLRVNTSQTCSMRLERDDYKTIVFRFEHLKTIWPSKNGKYVISKEHHFLRPTLNSTDSIFNMMLDNGGKTITSSPVITAFAGTYIALFVVDNALDLAFLPLDVPFNALDNSSVKTYNKWYVDIVMPFDEDGYFFEMLPKNKKAFSEKNLNEIRTKLFVLKNFDSLKSKKTEYVQALTALSNKQFVLPTPTTVPSKYFQMIF